MYKSKFPLVVKGTTELDCSSTSNLDVFQVFQSVRILRIMAMVSTVMSSTGAIVLGFYLRPTHGSTVGEVLLGTLSVGATAAVGSVYYKDLDSQGVLIQPGQEVVVKVSTAATTSGKVLSGFDPSESPEVPANNASLIASS